VSKANESPAQALFNKADPVSCETHATLTNRKKRRRRNGRRECGMNVTPHVISARRFPSYTRFLPRSEKSRLEKKTPTHPACKLESTIATPRLFTLPVVRYEGGDENKRNVHIFHGFYKFTERLGKRRKIRNNNFSSFVYNFRSMRNENHKTTTVCES
jgi:hypothetical protein